MKKRYYVALLVIFICILAGCTNAKTEGQTDKGNQSGESSENFNSEGFPLVDEKITLNMMGASSATQSQTWDELDVFKIYEEKTNIAFEFNTPDSANIREKLNLAFASGDLPDVLFGAGLTQEEEAKFGSQGQLIPLEGLIEKYAPNLQKLLEENKEVARSITTADGHIYSLPFVDTEIGFGPYPKIWINQVWLENLGLEMPETTDDLYNVLKAFKEKDPNGNGEADEIPMIASQDVNIAGAMLNHFGFTGHLDVTSGEVRYAPIEEEYKAFLSYMNTLYKEKLLDPEAYSQNKQQVNGKGENGQLGVFHDAGPFLTVGVERNEEYVALPPLTSEVNNEKLATRHSLVATGVFAITSANEYPEATIRWVDHFYSDEGAIFLNYGEEGEHFEYVDNKEGLKILIPEGMTRDEYRNTYTPVTTHPRIHAPIQTLELYKQDEFEPLNYHIMQETNKSVRPYAKSTFPIVHFTQEERDELIQIRTDIEDYVERMEAQFITGVQSLDGWDKYIKKLENMKVDRYVQIHQDAYDRWQAVE
ncbi:MULTISPECIES: extracellular solute-binding protein [Lederbergia]|uniref:ABC transporter substrate-binding protein n=2 Tax=Lederbergia TaxID=2804231 RepID=A0A178A1U5_9BACI|nr:MULTISPECIES: extracellular solute-binding protein [Lederbergia]KRG13133.1 hypothetical protein ACA30_16110 [Virgibacillus soli]MBP1916442.1 putative aldouronate transport system substrate-binding protein [Lederbergia galactosidilytica]OAK73510.1 hypothetical protein ABB05_06655 [Lederbergia galactosidilytica]GIN59069.1 ABC transporter substrate-binding protein [Lederbergia ruris]